MQTDFWQACWEQGKTGFHLSRVNPGLEKYWPRQLFKPGDGVFVPLCGKSLDLLWLARQGLQVLGVELIEKAVLSFFDENGLEFERRVLDGFVEYSSGSIRILCGNFFDLTAEHLTGCRGFYDRAALVALPADTRIRYARHLLDILPKGARGLALVLDYPQEDMQGPPFAVSPDEVQALLGQDCLIQKLAQRDILVHEPGFRDRGVTRMDEHIYLLAKNTLSP